VFYGIFGIFCIRKCEKNGLFWAKIGCFRAKMDFFGVFTHFSPFLLIFPRFHPFLLIFYPFSPNFYPFFRLFRHFSPIFRPFSPIFTDKKTQLPWSAKLKFFNFWWISTIVGDILLCVQAIVFLYVVAKKRPKMAFLRCF
jgi:hypothetical protein